MIMMILLLLNISSEAGVGDLRAKLGPLEQIQKEQRLRVSVAVSPDWRATKRYFMNEAYWGCFQYCR
jgi:hypothetical protein